MRILQLGKFYPLLGGVEKVMYDLTTGLSERGIYCDMMCALSKGGRHITVINDHAKLIGCRSLAKVAATMISPAMISDLRRRCRDYDIIHVHHPDPMACLALFLSGYKGKVVVHWHSDIEKQKFLLRLYHPLQTWLLKRADRVIGTTPIYTAESPCLTHVQDKIECLPIGVSPILPDSEKVAVLKSHYPGKKIIFSLGRLVAYKGYEWLIEAAKYLDDDYVVLIGGTGVLKNDLLAQIKKSNLEGKVKLLGRIPEEDLPSYYGACTLFCLSSVQKTEAFGIVQIEAMSCGKPVVATRIPQSGVAWVNEHGVSGLNVEPKNALELSLAISLIASDEKTYGRLATGATNRYRKMFTKDRMIDNVLQIYKSL